MKTKKPILALMPALVFSADLLAAPLVETKREEGSDIMYVDGYRMLISSPGADFRMIMDLEQKKAYMINPKNKTVMDMSEATWKALKAAFFSTSPISEIVGEARIAAQSAIALDPDFPGAWSALASIRFFFDCDWAGS